MGGKNEKRIYGEVLRPGTKTPVPLLIFSHELGFDHRSGSVYETLVLRLGMAFYAFDFCGGSVNGNKSDGKPDQMTVMTEVSDLEAVLSAAKIWDFVDTDRIILMGESQNGVVASITANRHAEDICALILLYPAFLIHADNRRKYQKLENVPSKVGLLGDWIEVGRSYVEAMWEFDVYQDMPSFSNVREYGYCLS